MVEAKVVDNGDGSYGVSYTPLKPGSYSVWICVKAQHIKVSFAGLGVGQHSMFLMTICHICCSRPTFSISVIMYFLY